LLAPPFLLSSLPPLLLPLFGYLFCFLSAFSPSSSPFPFSLFPSPPLSFVPLPLLPSLFSFPYLYLHFFLFFCFCFLFFSPISFFLISFLIFSFTPFFSLPSPPSSIPPPP
ncbi:unnamed protein product, partial [Prunus brigantina]